MGLLPPARSCLSLLDTHGSLSPQDCALWQEHRWFDCLTAKGSGGRSRVSARSPAYTISPEGLELLRNDSLMQRQHMPGVGHVEILHQLAVNHRHIFPFAYS